MGTTHYNKDGSITYYDPHTKETSVVKPATGGVTSGSGNSTNGGGIASSTSTSVPAAASSASGSSNGQSGYQAWLASDNNAATARAAGANDSQLRRLYDAGVGYNTAAANGNQAAADAYHAAAEAVRAELLYSGGKDGSQYLPFEQQQSTGGGGFSYSKAPSYTDKYSAQIDALLNEILNRDAFSYDALDDPLYQQYSKQYQREGQRAMQDTLGAVSARTGGLASSWATTAAQQANDYYASQLADKIPELYQLAYGMYLDDIDLKVQDAGLLQNMSDNQYNRYRDTMSDWRDDRDFAYGLYRDDIADERYAEEWAYQQGRDNKADTRSKDMMAAELLAQVGDYSGYQKLLQLSDEQVAALVKKYQEENGLTVTESSAGGSGGGWNNGKYSEGEVAKLQAWLGMSETEQDGRYGAKSAAKAKERGYSSLDAAMDAYRQDNTNDIALNGLYQRIVGYIENGSKTVAEIATMIEKSALSDKQKDELLTMLGYE